MEIKVLELGKCVYAGLQNRKSTPRCGRRGVDGIKPARPFVHPPARPSSARRPVRSSVAHPSVCPAVCPCARRRFSRLSFISMIFADLRYIMFAIDWINGFGIQLRADADAPQALKHASCYRSVLCVVMMLMLGLIKMLIAAVIWVVLPCSVSPLPSSAPPCPKLCTASR